MVTSTELVLGFVGSGESSARNVYALLSDYVDRHGPARFIVPITQDTWTETIQAVVEFAVDNGIPLEAVIDESNDKTILAWRAKANHTHKVTLPLWKITEMVAAAPKGRLVLLWNPEDAEAVEAVRLAWSKEVPILDLTAGLAPVEVTEENPTMDNEKEQQVSQALTAEDLAAMEDAEIEKLADEAGIDHTQYATWDEVRDLLLQQQPEPTPEPEPEPADDGSQVTQEWLDSLTDVELEGLADSLSIDHTTFATWDEVKAVILEQAQAQAGGVAGGTEAASLPTPEELEDWGFEQLKTFADDHGVEVAPRSRSAGYRSAIVEWLANQPAEQTGYEASEGVDEEALRAALNEMADTMERIGAILTKVDLIYDAIGNLGVNLDKKLGEFATTLSTAVQDLASVAAGPAPSTGVKKATTAAKAAPASAVAKAAPAGAKKAAPPTKTAASSVKAGVKRAGGKG